MNGCVIFGTGQAGMAMYRLMQREGRRVAAFGDNDETRWGTAIDGVPVWSLKQVAGADPEMDCIAIMNRETAESVRKDLLAAGFAGRIVTAAELKASFDIRLAVCRLLAAEIERKCVPGEIAELGVYRGAFAAELNRMFPERRLYLFDTFEGFDARDMKTGRDGQRAKAGDFSDTSEALVLGKMICPEQVTLRKGYFPDSLCAEDLERSYALVSLDADLYQPTMAGLAYFYPRLSPGGYMILDDYNSPQFPGAGQAVREFCAREGLAVVPLCDIHVTAVLAKAGGGR